MCGPRKKDSHPEGPYTLERPSYDIRDEPISEPEPYYMSYQRDPALHKPANNMNEELRIRRKQAQGFDK